MLTPVRVSEQKAMVRLASSLSKGSEERRAILGFLKRISKVTFAPFNKVDWYGMAGATSFSDGNPPYIGYFENLRTVPFFDSDGNPDIRYNGGMIVVDAVQISVQYLDEKGEGIAYASSKGLDDSVEALRVAEFVSRTVESGRLPAGMKVVHDDRSSSR